MTHKPVSVFAMLLALATMAEQHPSPQQLRPITLAGCPDKCGEISIPYPFGMKPGCFLDGFQVTCNYSFQPPRLFIEFEGMNKSYQGEGNGYYSEEDQWDLVDTTLRPVELVDISVARAEARAYGAVRSDCRVNFTHQSLQLELTVLTGPFILAAARNMLVGVGWSVQVDMIDSFLSSESPMSNCVLEMGYENRGLVANGSCSGFGCCQGDVSPALSPEARTQFGVGFKDMSNGKVIQINPCAYGMVVESSWYNFSDGDIYGSDTLTKKFPRGVPFVIDFAVRNGSCPTPGGPAPPGYACRSGNSFCANATNGPGYVCKCLDHYDGNPYIPDGCQDVDECALRDEYPDHQKEYPCSNKGICINRIGGYDCPCRAGMKGDGKNGTCTEQFPLPAKVVVVKKSINVNAALKEQFANEVIIQSRIIHKNIVKLIGCCLEVDIPMLVYEFISKGSLHDILHDQGMVQLNLNLRLRIAAEAAEGLAYMHSTATILHGDVKPANILLDDEFVPKISDFGISRLIAIDKAQHTKYVIGDRSYMDPVYLQTGILTKKSDVYSFGVVLLELISRKEASFSNNNSLVMNFIDAHKIKRRATELFDKDIIAPRNMELLDYLVGIAVDCLNLDVDQRPEMTQVEERLLLLKISHDK
nr:unnamed protein product [Digitaria exilis]